MDLTTRLAAVFKWRWIEPCPGAPHRIPTSVTDAEALTLAQAAAGGGAVEFGAAFGFSTITMARVATRVVSVEPTPGNLERTLRECAIENVTVLVATSLAVCAELASIVPAPLHVVFIDGDHSYATTLADLHCAEQWSPRTICLHDYTRIGDVRRAALEWGGEPDGVVDSMAVYSR